jgi:hypothetical protein
MVRTRRGRQFNNISLAMTGTGVSPGSHRGLPSSDSDSRELACCAWWCVDTKSWFQHGFALDGSASVARQRLKIRDVLAII